MGKLLSVLEQIIILTCRLSIRYLWAQNSYYIGQGCTRQEIKVKLSKVSGKDIIKYPITKALTTSEGFFNFSGQNQSRPNTRPRPGVGAVFLNENTQRRLN
jgi:hypothetical protein